MRLASVFVSILLLISCASPRPRDNQVDTQIARVIAATRAIDNHAHPVRFVREGPADVDYDALPVETMDPSPEPVRTRADSPELLQAWSALFDYRFSDRTPEHVRQVSDRKKSLMQEEGDNYPAWVLDRLGIETMLANRVSMGPSITTPRFLWVPYADALMYPLNNAGLASANSDRKAFFADEDRLLKRYLTDLGMTAVPESFDDYLKKVVTATLERQRRGGAVAEKFEAAYLRSLNFGNPSRADAEQVYKTSRGSVPAGAAYKTLQDFLFRYIAAECGRLGMAVHLHAASGAGGYFDVGGANPMNLESVLNEPALRKTNFVMIHGGWPFTREVTALLTKPNAYLDFSEQTFMIYPGDVAESIRQWLEYVPEKVLFATDAYPFSAEMGWEEAGWVAADGGRQALGIALTGMLRDGEITQDRAAELARMVLRDNARKLYSLP